MKRPIINKISMSLAFLLGLGAIAGASSALFAKKNPISAEAATETKATLTKANIIDAASSEATINGIKFDWGDSEFTVSGSTLRVDADHCPNILVASSHLSSNNVTHVSVNITYTASVLNTQLQVIEGFTNKRVDVSLTGTSYSSGDVSIDNSKMLMIKIMNNGTEELNNLTINSFSLDLKGIPAKSAVTIAKGTGVKSVYLSTSNTATSGSASGTEYDNDTTVYGFAELAKGYNAPSEWALVSGTAHTEGAKYRVGSVTAGTTNDFGTINASLANYNISYTLNGGSVSGNPTSYNVNSNAITLKNPTKTGYTFTGWTGSCGSTPQTSVTIAKGSVGNKSYTANWQLNTYNISYTLNGGALPSGKTNPSTYNVETTTFTLNNPERVGYNFVGWTGSNGSTPQTTVTITKGSTGNKSYTANWTLVSELQTVVDAINNIGGPTNISYPGSKTNLENAELLYNSLSSDYKTVLDTDYAELVDELSADRGEYDALRSAAINDTISKIDAIGDTISYPGSREVIFAARDALAGLDESDRSDTVVTNLNDYNDALDSYNALKDVAADQVIEAINDIVTDGEGKAIYPNSKSSLENAESLYDNLAPEEKYPSSTISNYNDLVLARSEYNASRDDTLNEVTNAIDAISQPFDGDRKAQIANAQQLFGALDSSDKNALVIANLNKLEDAKAADAVIDMIEALPAVSDTDEYRALLSGVREQYEALSDDQEAFVPRTSDIYDSLVEKEEAINVIDAINAIGDVSYPGSKALIDAANLAYANYINSGYNPNYIVNYDVLDKDNDDFSNADAVAKIIEAIPAPIEDQSYYGAVDNAIAAYNALEDDEKHLLIEAIFDPVTNMTFAEYLSNQGLAKDAISKIDAIGDVTYNAGVSDSLADILAAETAYNAIKDNEYAKAIVDSINYQTLVEARTIYDHVDEVADLISALTPAADQSYYDAVDAALAAYDNLTDDEQAIIDAAPSVNYEKVLADHIAAKEVIETIGEIGTLTYDGGVNDSLSDIILAEEAYDAIKDNADVKAIVDSVNYDTLVGDRASYDRVDAVVKLIEAIGEVKHDVETETQLLATRVAYDALSEEEKALVNSYNNTYKTLEDDEHVYEALVKIDAIGEVSYDTRSEEAIKEAREYYNSLTEDQKKQLGEQPFVTLSNAESTYANKKQGANIIVIIFLIVASITLLAGVWFLIRIIKGKKSDNNGSGKSGKKEPVKALSVGGLLPFVTLTSHYVDAPYIVLYVLVGVAVLIWISVLALAIMKKKQVGPFKKKAEVAKVEPQTSISQNEDEEVETVSDEKGNIFQIRYIKSFTAKLIQSPEETKKYYEELKNQVLSYKKTNSRVSWHYDAINSGREYVLKFAIRGKTLCVYLPLDPEKVEEKYKVERSESKKYEDVPVLYRIKNDRRLGYAKELIAVVANNLGLEKGEEQHEVYSNLPHEPNKPLVAKGLIKEQKVQVNKPAEQQVLETKVNSDGDEIVVTKDEKGNIFEIRYIKSFTAKLSQSEKEVKDYYTLLKNYALSYKDAHSRVSWHYDAINVGRDYVLKFVIRGKTLCVYFALDASKLEEKYKVEEAKGKKYEDVPVLYRIKNDRRCQYAKELIDEVMKKVDSKQGEIPSENYSLPHESTEALLAKGLIKELKTAVKKPEIHKVEHLVASISVEEADKLMSDEDAGIMIEVDNSSKKHEGKKAIINIDELEANFNDGDKITLETLQEKKLIAKDVGRVKLLARGQLDKKLDVHLQDYSIQAVKMILLVGGKVQKAK